MVIGKYVKTFKEASHALPDGMSMNADYPFMIPAIRKIDGRDVVLCGRFGDGQFRIVTRRRDGQQYCVIAQSSTYEKIYRKPPAKFRAYPFKDEHTPAIGDVANQTAPEFKR